MTISWIEEVFGCQKPVIGMCHFNALPGDPSFDRQKGMEDVLDWARKDLLALRKGGVDAVMLEAWGATPVAISYGEAYEAFSRGVVEAVSGSSMATMGDLHYYDVADYFMWTGAGTVFMNVVVINKDVYDELPPDIQKIMDEESQIAANDYAQLRKDLTENAVRTVLKTGDDIYALPASVQAELRTLAEDKVIQWWLGDVTKAGWSEAFGRQVFEREKAIVAELASKSTYTVYPILADEIKKEIGWEFGKEIS